MTVIDWLLDSDPSIRWQVMRDLTLEPSDDIAAERSRVATEGWGNAAVAKSATRGAVRLLTILHPDVVLRSDFGAKHRAASVVHRDAVAVTGQARGFPGAIVQPALVNGTAGAVITVRGRPIAVMGFTVVRGRIVEIDAIADPERVARVAAGVV